MHALSSRIHTPDVPALQVLVAWLSQLFAPQYADALPAEVRRLPERMLRDIGLDPRTVRSEHSGTVTQADMLHSPRAMAEFLATTVR